MKIAYLAGLSVGVILVSAFLFLFFFKRTYRTEPMTFDSTSQLAEGVQAGSVIEVLGKDVSMGTGRGFRQSTISYSRLDCKPEALLANPAKFTWWLVTSANQYSRTTPPGDKSKIHEAVLPFPEFGVEQPAWSTHFTLQANNTWVGQYEGLKIKPIGVSPDSFYASTSTPDQQWLHVYFKNSSGKRTYFCSSENRLIIGDRENLLSSPPPRLDGEFYGTTAHCHIGSIFRPELGSKIMIAWGFQAGGNMKTEVFELPEFSDDSRHWYCYFTLGKDGKWTAVFEGVKEK